MLALLLLAQAAGPLDVYGRWVIPPEEEGGPSRGVVEIERVDGAPVGRIVEVGEVLEQVEGEDASDALGMRIVWGFEDGGDQWEDGKIRDPEAGRTYRAEMRREGDSLSVEGCVLFICREQVWRPADDRGGSVTETP